ncbi:signal peptidase II [Aquimarina mytili]|uniref:Lipoprotein signal peptidase n=1 Tax=Aquimarina mytili TaxID=874423 RepID=A0A937D8D2_9FLAO|nr:signal peptidase II [Aquimarina mytili]MBL0682572.1 signal peptidase II [Aquimarina mytili]
MKVSKKTRIIAILSLVFLNISCDQISKSIVRKTIEPYERIEVLKNNFVLTKVENTGAAYSLGSDLTPVLKILVLQILPILVLLLLLRLLLIKVNYSKTTIIGLAFIIGGGIGNLFDRIVYGSVTDFLIMDLGIIKTEIFNIADVSIMTGSVLIILSTFLSKNETFFTQKTSIHELD